MRKFSLTYLILGSLSLVGYVAFFMGWPFPIRGLFILALPFYLASITFLIFVHPALCLVQLVKTWQDSKKKVMFVHFIWSLAIASTYQIMISSGYYLSV